MSVNPARTLVIGYGSIGQRHAHILSELGTDVAVLSRRSHVFPNQYSNLTSALLQLNPTLIVIANETQQHADILQLLEHHEYQGVVLVEKPLYSNVKQKQTISFPTFVGYNLRFHPLIGKLKALLETCTVYTANIHAGQYLPTWRPSSNYRKSYSAQKELGGGVLRDLSHELDYTQWLLGPVTQLVSLGGKVSHLDIDSDDHFFMLAKSTKCPAIMLSLNYLDRPARRTIHLTTNQGNITLDLISGTLHRDEKLEDSCSLERNETYLAQHQALIAGNYQTLCSYSEGLSVMYLIEAAERAFLEESWINL